MKGFKNELINHIQLAHNIALKILENKEDAEDVVQDTYLNLIKQLEKGVEIRHPKAYIAKLTYNRAIDKIRSIKIHKESLGRISMRNQHNELIESMRESLKELPQEEQVLLSLAYSHEFSHKEIADITGIPKGTVWKKITEAKEKIKVKLSLAGLIVADNQFISTINEIDLTEGRSISSKVVETVNHALRLMTIPAIQGATLLSTLIFIGGLMIKKTIILIIGLVAVTGLFFYSLNNKNIEDPINVAKEAETSEDTKLNDNSAIIPSVKNNNHTADRSSTKQPDRPIERIVHIKGQVFGVNQQPVELRINVLLEGAEESTFENQTFTSTVKTYGFSMQTDTNGTLIASIKYKAKQGEEVILTILPSSNYTDINARQTESQKENKVSMRKMEQRLNQIVGFEIDPNNPEHQKILQSKLLGMITSANIDPNNKNAVSKFMDEILNGTTPAKATCLNENSALLYFGSKTFILKNIIDEITFTLNPLSRALLICDIYPKINDQTGASSTTVNLDIPNFIKSEYLSTDPLHFNDNFNEKITISVPANEPLIISAYRHNFLESTLNVSPLKTGESRTVKIEMTKGGFKIAGIVLDEDRKLLKSAFVTVFSGSPQRPVTMASQTNAEGEFIVEGLPSENLSNIRINFQGYEQLSLNVKTINELPSIFILKKVRKGSKEFKGKVVDESGAPIRNVRVKGIQLSNPNFSKESTRFYTVTDKDGNFVLKELLDTSVSSITFYTSNEKYKSTTLRNMEWHEIQVVILKSTRADAIEEEEDDDDDFDIIEPVQIDETTDNNK
ncbi:MAG: sigma-70 family RNA polymerase sigma factor [Planctomycetes bacterium]|nr:sigma-70 family RNA polymerase sigma factor [Planctomycetota bacterium]